MKKAAQMWLLGPVVLMLVAVSATMAFPVVETSCTPANVEVISNSFSLWISSFMSQGNEPAAVALSIFSSCNTNGDSALDQTELTTCLQSELTVPISDSCSSVLLHKLDTNSDGAVDLSELTVLISLFGGQKNDQQRQRRNYAAKKNLEKNVLKENRSDRSSESNGNSHSREDLLRENRSDGVSSESDSSSYSREDLLRENRSDRSIESNSISNSREDLLRENRSDGVSSEFHSSSNSREDLLR